MIELSNSIGAQCDSLVAPTHSAGFAQESGRYYVAKSLYDLREFRRAAHALQNCQSDEAFFLRNYSLYMVRKKELTAGDFHVVVQAGERDKEDDIIDTLGAHELAGLKNAELCGLKQSLGERHDSGKLDGYGCYLYVMLAIQLRTVLCMYVFVCASYAVVLKASRNEEEARKLLLESLSLIPLLWCSWQELAKLCDNREMVCSNIKIVSTSDPLPEWVKGLWLCMYRLNEGH